MNYQYVIVIILMLFFFIGAKEKDINEINKNIHMLIHGT